MQMELYLINKYYGPINIDATVASLLRIEEPTCLTEIHISTFLPIISLSDVKTCVVQAPVM